MSGPRRRGRPPGTSAAELERVALDLFERRGYDGTTVDDIASAAGISRRTYFRYFDTKADVLWSEFDSEVEAIGAVLARTPPSSPVPEAVRSAVLAVNRYRAADVPGLRRRMSLIATVPELAASAARHYDAWEHEIARFVAGRAGAAVTDLYPQTVARTTLAACRAAYEQWTTRADADLTVYLDAALRILFAASDGPSSEESAGDAVVSTST